MTGIAAERVNRGTSSTWGSQHLAEASGEVEAVPWSSHCAFLSVAEFWLLVPTVSTVGRTLVTSSIRNGHLPAVLKGTVFEFFRAALFPLCQRPEALGDTVTDMRGSEMGVGCSLVPRGSFSVSANRM